MRGVQIRLNFGNICCNIILVLTKHKYFDLEISSNTPSPTQKRGEIILHGYFID